MRINQRPPDSHQPRHPWSEGVYPPEQTPLQADVSADVCVVGAGIAGLTTAFCLSTKGANVVVVEAGGVGEGATGRTTAHISNAMDDRFLALEEMHGEEKARLIVESHTAAIDQIESIVREESLDCDFARLEGYLFAASGKPVEDLDRELDAAHRAGLHAVSMVAKAPLDGFDTGKALLFPAQAQFHPMKYLLGLYRGITDRGGRIFTGSRVTEVHGEGQAYVKTSSGYTAKADALVVATNSPDILNKGARSANTSGQVAYTTYAIAATIPGASIPLGLFWDTEDPYHYIRIQRGLGGDLFIIGGEDEKAGQTNTSSERWRQLEMWARSRFSSIENFDYRWSGTILETVDRLAFIGHAPEEENVFVASGDSGHGMTYGTIAGMLLTDLILERDNPWATLYDPSRITSQHPRQPIRKLA
jgi:glycine/D-amino acid oxidase-like deaminating enzyme